MNNTNTKIYPNNDRSIKWEKSTEFWVNRQSNNTTKRNTSMSKLLFDNEQQGIEWLRRREKKLKERDISELSLVGRTKRMTESILWICNKHNIPVPHEIDMVDSLTKEKVRLTIENGGKSLYYHFD